MGHQILYDIPVLLPIVHEGEWKELCVHPPKHSNVWVVKLLPYRDSLPQGLWSKISESLLVRM